MNIWTVANQKGGVGKTTTSVTLGGSLAARGNRTLLIDLDPHGSLTSYFGCDPDSIEESVYSLFHRQIGELTMPLASMLRRTQEPLIDFLPASTALITLDRQIGSLRGKGLLIREALKQYRSHYQHVIIDCSPALGILMVNALSACDHLVIPVQTEFLAIKGLQRMLNTLKMFSISGKKKVEYTILPTLYDKRTRASRDSLHYMEVNYADRIWQGYIPVDTQFREASRLGRPLSILNPDARGVRAYDAFLDDLVMQRSVDTVEYKEAV